MKKSQIIIISVILMLIIYISMTIVTANQNSKVPESESMVRDNNFIEIEYRVMKLSTKVNNIIQYAKDNDESGILDNAFSNSNIYKDCVVYGDEVCSQANDLGCKILFLDNLIGNLNYYYDDVNLLIYSDNDNKCIGNSLNELNSEIEEANTYIAEYNKNLSKKEHYSYITILKKFYPETSREYKKELKIKLKEQGEQQ